MTDNPITPGETGVTIKYGKGYDDTWVTFRGTPDSVRSQLCETFGLKPEGFDTLSELVLEATALAHGANNAASGAGGRSIPKDQKSEGAPAQEAKPEEKPASPLLERVEEATDVKQLQHLWASNKEAFADADLMAAWKAKGKSLKG